MHRIRSRAIAEISNFCPCIDPVDQVALAVKHDVPEWLPRGYAALCQRAEPIEIEEAMKLGIETTVKLAKARETVRRASDYAQSLKMPDSARFDDDLVTGVICDIFWPASNLPAPEKTASASDEAVLFPLSQQSMLRSSAARHLIVQEGPPSPPDSGSTELPEVPLPTSSETQNAEPQEVSPELLDTYGTRVSESSAIQSVDLPNGSANLPEQPHSPPGSPDSRHTNFLLEPSHSGPSNPSAFLLPGPSDPELGALDSTDKLPPTEVLDMLFRSEIYR